MISRMRDSACDSRRASEKTPLNGSDVHPKSTAGRNALSNTALHKGRLDEWWELRRLGFYGQEMAAAWQNGWMEPMLGDPSSLPSCCCCQTFVAWIVPRLHSRPRFYTVACSGTCLSGCIGLLSIDEDGWVEGIVGEFARAGVWGLAGSRLLACFCFPVLSDLIVNLGGLASLHPGDHSLLSLFSTPYAQHTSTVWM